MKLEGIEIGTAQIYRGKNVILNGIVTSQSKAVAHFVKQYKLQQDTNAGEVQDGPNSFSNRNPLQEVSHES